MKNIILQHMTGSLRELDVLSTENIKQYANLIGADYRLLLGNVFSEKYWSPIQKVYMLNEEFDDYDNVLMLDIDMFAVKNLQENVFEVSGIGLYGDVQKMLHRRIVNAHRNLASMKYPYWGGAIYKLSRNQRRHLREGLKGDTSWIDVFSRHKIFGDEGVMSTLANKTKFKCDAPYFADNSWCYCSFLPKPETAKFIHIRTKITPTGPKQEKIQNYHALKNKGILD